MPPSALLWSICGKGLFSHDHQDQRCCYAHFTAVCEKSKSNNLQTVTNVFALLQMFALLWAFFSFTAKI